VTLGEKTRVLWKPDMHRIERVVLKNARGQAYYEYGEPMLEGPTNLWALPLESVTATGRQDFEAIRDEGSLTPWPEVGSRMMTRSATGEGMVGQWVIVQEGVYRYSVQQDCGLRVRSVIFEYLATEVRWEH
jgi:hypothetical protein